MDNMQAGARNDTVYADGWVDDLDAYLNADSGEGDDNLLGDAGNDLLYGGAGVAIRFTADGRTGERMAARASVGEIATAMEGRRYSCEFRHRFEISPFKRPQSFARLDGQTANTGCRASEIFPCPRGLRGRDGFQRTFR